MSRWMIDDIAVDRVHEIEGALFRPSCNTHSKSIGHNGTVLFARAPNSRVPLAGAFSANVPIEDC